MDTTHHYNDYSSAADCRTWWLNSPRAGDLCNGDVFYL